MSAVLILEKFKIKLLSNKLLSDSIWAVLGNVLGKGIGLISGIFVARILGSYVYGEFGVIRNLVISTSIFSTFGLGYTATKYIAENKLSNPKLVGAILKYCQRITFLVSGILALTLLTFSSFFANEILKVPHLSSYIQLASVLVIFNAINTTQIGVISGFGNFKELSNVNILTGVASFITSILFSFFYGLNGLIGSLIFCQIINFLMFGRIIKTNQINYPNTEIVNYEFLRGILIFSLPIALQEGFYALSAILINLLLHLFSDLKEVGFYAAAIQWYITILMIPAVLRNVIISHLTGNNKDNLKFNKLLNSILKYTLIILVISFCIIIMSSSYIEQLYGPSFVGLKTIIIIQVFSAVFDSLSTVYNQAYLSVAKNWQIFIFRLFRDLGIITTFYVLYKLKLNLRGALLLSLCSLAYSTIYFIVVSFYYKFQINSKK